MNCDERKELLFSNLDECFTPKDAFADRSLRGKWRAVELETNEYSGKMLYAVNTGTPTISFSPNLSGWYKIYLHMPGKSLLYAKLTSDPCYLSLRTDTENTYVIEEVLWRCVDMTGESISLSKYHDATESKSMLSAIKFVPMTDAEVEKYKSECASTEHRRIYATDDMHNRLAFINQDSVDEWRAVARNYEHSDVEWLAIESTALTVSDNLDDDEIDKYNYPSQHDYHVQKAAKKYDRFAAIRTVADECRKMGIKSCVSTRMGAWGMLFPYDGLYIDSAFAMAHPEWRTRDRNGDEIRAMSYAYPEVRKYIIDELVACAACGVDAVSIMANRGIPYVLFEKPIADKFYELYGEYPYNYPIDEPRLNAIHCEVMTTFMRELRTALDEKFGKGKIQIHYRSLYSIYDNKYLGLDIERWTREGLVDVIAAFSTRVHEKLDGDVWEDESRQRIDLEKYTKYVRTRHLTNLYAGQGPNEWVAPMVDFRGNTYGPKDLNERVSQWMELEKKYGVKIYFELLTCSMTGEDARKRAVNLYNAGANGLSYFDAYDQAVIKPVWSALRRLGHKEEVATMDLGEGEYYRTLFMLKIGGRDMNRFNPNWGG